ncbi:Gfo/Idh/MocA family protein [Evansella tamaricis]|uniref:Gfo/Idh/MocA family oxidoreductase n=1 Tax=Evansella tamaricis TaxID=2069301 RepID=A0ABS6JME9_9BACI|nr:Gfo/Idh/MocA family oxidoreductase [Evansella tamaricis]MBU9714022.1 Gfo/Idh/MocA family oxidoreductase [Evansella tamaricis]
MVNKLRVGIIGAGAIARSAHIPNYQNDPRVDVVAVANHNLAKAESCADEFNIPHAYENYLDMLNDVAVLNLDAVSICTPNKFHARQAIDSLNAGVHVLCEKPPAVTDQEARQMNDAATKAGKILSYCFHYRHSPEVRTLKKFIEAGELGDIYAASVYAVRRRGIPGWGVFTNKDLQGGGALIDIGVHMLDTALYLMGYPEPDTVLGVTYEKLGKRPGVGLLGKWDWENFSVEDMARGMITFKNGASITLDAAFAANVEKDDVMNVTLTGDMGGANVFPLKIFQEKYETLLDVTPAYLAEENYHANLIAEFIEGCLTETQPISTRKQGLILQKIVNGLYHSAQTGRAVIL